MELQVKQAIVATTNSAGWHHIKALAEMAVAAAERKALDCEDDSKIVGLQRKAQAAREFLNTFLALIEQSRMTDEPVEEFIEVSF